MRFEGSRAFGPVRVRVSRDFAVKHGALSAYAYRDEFGGALRPWTLNLAGCNRQGTGQVCSDLMGPAGDRLC